MNLTKAEKSFFDRIFRENPLLNQQYHLINANSILKANNVKVLFHDNSKQDFYFDIIAAKITGEDSYAYIQCGQSGKKDFFHITFLAKKDIDAMLFFAKEHSQKRKSKLASDDQKNVVMFG